MAKGRQKQNIKVENMIDSHILLALDVLGAILNGKDAKALIPTDVERPKLNGRTTLVRKRTETRMQNRLAGPKAQENLEDLL